MDLFGQTARGAAIDELHAATAIYTAEPVVDALLDRLDWPRTGRRLVDPSCGDGIFLERALVRLLQAMPGISAHALLDQIEGWEVHPHAAHQARSRVTHTLVTVGGWTAQIAAKIAGQLVRNADFLTQGPKGRRYHAIAGNPPYLRFVNVPEILRDEYKAATPTYAQKDLLHSFLATCPDLLEPDGEVAFVTSDRWLFGCGAAALREAIGRDLSVHHLERLDPATAFYRPKQRAKGTPPRIHPVAVVLAGHAAGAVPLSRQAIYPDALPEDMHASVRLREIAEVRLAPWLGKEGMFVVSAEQAKRLPPELLVPAVDTDDIKDGVLGEPRRFAIRTQPGVEPPGEILEHLTATRSRLAATGQRRKDWWLPPEPWHHLSLDREALLVPRISKELRTVRLPAGVLAINHNITIVSAGSATLDEIETSLATERARGFVRRCSPDLENGYLSITTELLRLVPVE